MLVLGIRQKVGESKVFIEVDGKVIVVQLLDVQGGNVRLGFEASKEITIDREAIHNAKQNG